MRNKFKKGNKYGELLKGRKKTESHCLAISIGRKKAFANGSLKLVWDGKSRPKVSNEKNGNWKGNRCSKSSLHKWVERHKPKPNLCVMCNERPPRDAANISQKYLRNIDDFEWLCRRCHMKKDGRLEKLNGESM